MKNIYLILAFLVISCNCINAQVKKTNGMLLGIGSGSMTDMELMSDFSEIGGTYTAKYNINGALGYRFQFQPMKKKYFFNVDLWLGMKSITISYQKPEPSMSEDSYSISQDDELRLYSSLNGSFNYHLIKGLSAGIGIEPTYYFMQKVNFDIPATAKLAYDWNRIGLAFIYKYGFTDVLKSEENLSNDLLSSGKFRDWQIQLYLRF